MSWLLPNELTPTHLELFGLLSDALIHNVSPEKIRPYINPSFDEAKIQEYVRTVTKPSENPRYGAFIEEAVKSTSQVGLFATLMTILDLRILSPVLTGTTKLFRDMTEEERAVVLRRMRDSPIELKNKVFKSITILAFSTFQRVCPDIHNEAMGYPRVEAREKVYDGFEHEVFKYVMTAPPSLDGVELYMPNVDVAIIGSGSGAGVVAHTLAQENIKVLVIEKGKYYSPDELKFDDSTGYKALYEAGGALTTSNAQALILAGSTFGGGSTVNWLACLKTPFKVRKEWYEDHKLDWVATEEYDNEMDYVLKQMGALTEHINHLFSNTVLLSGAEKLGYLYKQVPQNNGKHADHDCGFCHLGCKWGIKQGSLANWLRDASENGAEFMDQVRAEKILRDKHGHAYALACVDTRNGHKFTIRGPRKFVVASGALQTPVLLQKSGFKNKHIGRNLKLHPITTLLAYWENKQTNPHHHSIMTSVVMEAEDIDGKAHGAKIETLLHTPMIEAAFLPWDNSDQMRQDLLKYQGTSAFIILTRDTSSGVVTYNTDKEDSLDVDYSINKTDRAHMVKAIVVAADCAYVEGANEITFPYEKVPRFHSHKPKDERSINDEDYQAWRKIASATKLPMFGPGYGSAHQMASCRMSGKGPSDGACDTKGRLYESDNVYVADASAMPTASGSNPMVSTMAIARHVALGIAKEMKPAAKL